MLMLFYSFRSEETDLKKSRSYVLKLDKDVIATVNKNKGMFEPNDDLVDLTPQNHCNHIM